MPAGGGQECAARRRRPARRRAHCDVDHDVGRVRVDRRARGTTATAGVRASTTVLQAVVRQAQDAATEATGSARIGADVTRVIRKSNEDDAVRVRTITMRCVHGKRRARIVLRRGACESRSHFARNSVECGMRERRKFHTILSCEFCVTTKTFHASAGPCGPDTRQSAARCPRARACRGGLCTSLWNRRTEPSEM